MRKQENRPRASHDYKGSVDFLLFSLLSIVIIKGMKTIWGENDDAEV